MWIVGLLLGLVIGGAINGFEGALLGALIGWAIGYGFGQLIRGHDAKVKGNTFESRLASVESALQALDNRLSALEVRPAAETVPQFLDTGPDELAPLRATAVPTPTSGYVDALPPAAVETSAEQTAEALPASGPQRAPRPPERAARTVVHLALVHGRQHPGARGRGGAVLRHRLPAQVRLRAHAHSDRAASDRCRHRGRRLAGHRLAPAAETSRLRARAARRRCGCALSHRVRRLPPLPGPAARGSAGPALPDRVSVRGAGRDAGRAVAGRARRERRVPCADSRFDRQRQPRHAVQLLRDAQRRHRRHCLVPGLAAAQPAGFPVHLRASARCGAAASTGQSCLRAPNRSW